MLLDAIFMLRVAGANRTEPRPRPEELSKGLDEKFLILGLVGKEFPGEKPEMGITASEHRGIEIDPPAVTQKNIHRKCVDADDRQERGKDSGGSDSLGEEAHGKNFLLAENDQRRLLKLINTVERDVDENQQEKLDRRLILREENDDADRYRGGRCDHRGV